MKKQSARKIVKTSRPNPRDLCKLLRKHGISLPRQQEAKRHRHNGRVAASPGQVVPYSPQDAILEQSLTVYQGLCGSGNNSPEAMHALYQATVSMFETLKQQNYSKGAYDSVARTQALRFLAELLLLGQQCPDLVLLAANGLVDLSSTDKTGNVEWTQLVVRGTNVVPNMVPLIHNANVSLRLAVCLFVGNLARTEVKFRDELLAMPGVVQGLVNNLTEPQGHEIANGASGAVSALSNGPFHDLSVIQSFVEPLVGLIKQGLENHKDNPTAPDIFLNAITAAGDLLCENRTQQQVCAMYHKTILVTIMELIGAKHDHADVVRVSVNMLGTFIWANVPDAIKDLNETGFFSICIPLLEHDSHNVNTQTCWALANVSADTEDKKEYLFGAGNGHPIVEKLVQIALTGRWQSKREAIFAVLQLILGGTFKQVEVVVREFQGLQVLSNVLGETPEIELVDLALMATNALLELNQLLHKAPRYHELLDEYKVIEKVEKMACDAIDPVRTAASNIMVKHFDHDHDNDENAPVLPQQQQQAAAAASVNNVVDTSTSTSPPRAKKRRRVEGDVSSPPAASRRNTQSTSPPVFGVRTMNGS